jgi:hypothetical protein
MADQDEVLRQISRSGFPFQLRVEDEIRTTSSEHGWNVASREHPWRSPDGDSSGFIDIVLRHEQFNTFRLVIECKRVKADDSRQLRWLFLLPDRGSNETELASCFEVEGEGNRPGSDLPWKDLRLWENVSLVPASFESEFCVLPSDEPRNRPLLERLAAEVLESIEGLAHEEACIERSRGGSQYQHLRLFIFPAIVTNAEITVCRFDPSRISITDGLLDPAGAMVEAVPFIRFRKSLATGFPQGAFNDLHAANKARERTVFVVNAAALPTFLKGWDMHPLGFDSRYGIQRLWGQ